MAGKIPVTVVTGFLGSGKTTLIRYVLESKEHGKRVAVVENEFATELGVKNELRDSMAQASCVAELFETSSGCLCCGGAAEFKRILQTLIKHRERFDYILVETTGLVDPAFVANFFLEPELEAALHLDGIVTMVDAVHIDRQLDRPLSEAQKKDPQRTVRQVLNEAQEQVVMADLIVVNKCDLVDEPRLEAIEARLRALNPVAGMLRTEFSRVPLDRILDVHAFDLDRVLARDEGFLDFRPYRTHDKAIQSLSLVGRGTYDVETLREWLTELLNSREHAIFRSKGCFSVEDSDERHIFQGVHASMEIEPFTATGEDSNENRFVFIGMDLDPAEIRLCYKRHFPAGPKLALENFSGFQQEELDRRAEDVAPYLSIFILLILFAVNTNYLPLGSFSGNLTFALGLISVAAILIITGILRPRQSA